MYRHTPLTFVHLPNSALSASSNSSSHLALHSGWHGLGGKAPITREAMEAGLRRNTIVRKASITQGDRVQLKGEEGGAADVNSR